MSNVIPAADIERITNLRVTNPAAVRAALRDRTRPAGLPADGKMMLIAADHPARGAISVGSDPSAMADRASLLGRIVAALAQPGVDGILGQPDILEDLAVLGALDGKLVFGTMNRGGIVGANWELDDRMTAYDAAHTASMNLDGAKMLLRIEDTDPGVARTIESCAQAVTELADRDLIAMLEPLPYKITAEGKAKLVKDDAKLIRATAIAAGMGATSAYTWLKLPAWSDIAAAAAVSTLPVLILGGDPGKNWDSAFTDWARALEQPTVRGLVIGRALLFPPDGDVASAVQRAAALVRPGGTS
ncbi:MAG: Cgl0159 family (beta/alpha)8-fold protein [Candidatus Nanopelagicales bacterium]